MRNLNTKHKHQRVEILVRGTVQGVGFRPFIYNLASRFEIVGTVTNTSDGVVIIAAAQHDRLQLFIEAIQEQAPPLACITSIETRSFTISTEKLGGSFSILPSIGGATANTAIPPDIALCNDCLSELLDPDDRRFQYPFINCTNCGPRFTIVETIPYDRPLTSMKVFPMCDACTKEYQDPGNRRFHAQPNACPDCGPNISLHNKEGIRLPTSPPLEQTAISLNNGLVLAIRGMGGFHLSVNGCSPQAVALLRERKGRPDKPLAIMVADVKTVKSFCLLHQDEEKILTSPQHPIVLLKKRPNTTLAENLAPGIDEIGVMLPYTPLHHLLFQQTDCPQALVMTSGNVSGTPICTANGDALARLASIADLFLLHNREIVTRVDDSVIKIMADRSFILRRARGLAPSPIQIAWKLPKILACGPGLKNTFSLGRDQSVFPSQHIGDLDNLESYEFYQESIEHFKKVFQIEPEAVACDLHPDYMSSRYAAETKLPKYKIQHHHAHAVAVMAEHGIDEPVLAIVLDGTGLGDDGTIWGGEILRAELTSYERLGHLSHLRLPGGDVATTEPWRIGISALFHTFGTDGIAHDRLPETLRNLDGGKLAVISSMLTGGFNSPLTSSCGRLFDAIASLLGLRQYISYEGQAAMELETLAKRARTSSWHNDILPISHIDILSLLQEKNGKWEICSAEFVKRTMDGIRRGEPKPFLALQFHEMLISSITRLIEILSLQTGIRKVVLSGGCMQNSLLLEGLFHTLKSKQFKIFTGNSLPINDGAISFG
ncbi:MAG: carbamoyltransferase HypF, partial [Proteobacteria bacterium]|nr:carbamoyltransferase HypF [Pseudomonadota bacterium]